VAPDGRFGTPEEIANAIIFVLSKDASFMTGADLMVDGALHFALRLVLTYEYLQNSGVNSSMFSRTH
jgi:hypothetical protein